MADRQSGAPPPGGLARRAALILLDPRTVYAGLSVHPRALGMMLLVPALTAGALVTFVSTDMGRGSVLGGVNRLLGAAGTPWGTMVHGVVHRMVTETPWAVALIPCVFIPLGMLGVAWLLHAVCSLGMGGRATRHQTLAMVAHASLILAIGVVFTIALGLTRGVPTLIRVPSMVVRAVPASLAPTLGTVDPFIVWWTANLSIGLGVLHGWSTRPIVIVLLATYGALLAAPAPRVGV